MVDLSSHEETLVMDITIASCTLSLLGSLFIIVFFLAFEELRRFAHRLICYLAIAEFFWAGSFLLGPLRDSDGMCPFQSVLITYFGLTVVLWTICISFALSRCISHPTVNMEDYERRYLLICYCSPLVVAAIPLATGSYGETIGWCWISKHSGPSVSFMWELLLFYGPLWVAFAVNSYYSFTVHRISRGLIVSGAMEGEEKQDRLKFLKNLKWIPLSLIGCWMLATLDRLYLLAHPDAPSFTLTLLHYGVGCLHGLVICVIYLLNPLVSRTVKHSCFPYLVTKSTEMRRAS